MKKSELLRKNEIKKYINILEEFSKHYSTIGIEATFGLEKNNKFGKNIYPLDIFILSTIIRSATLTKGFCNEIISDNPLCAISIVRMHFDTLLNLYSLFIVEDPLKCAKKTLKGRHLKQNKFIDKEIDSEEKIAKDMRKSDLIKIDGTKLYEKYSCYIHLSEQHMKRIMETNKDGKVSITMPDGLVNSDSLVLEGCKDMAEITKNLFVLWRSLDRLIIFNKDGF